MPMYGARYSQTSAYKVLVGRGKTDRHIRRAIEAGWATELTAAIKLGVFVYHIIACYCINKTL